MPETVIYLAISGNLSSTFVCTRTRRRERCFETIHAQHTEIGAYKPHTLSTLYDQIVLVISDNNSPRCRDVACFTTATSAASTRSRKVATSPLAVRSDRSPFVHIPTVRSLHSSRTPHYAKVIIIDCLVKVNNTTGSTHARTRNPRNCSFAARPGGDRAEKPHAAAVIFRANTSAVCPSHEYTLRPQARLALYGLCGRTLTRPATGFG